MCTEDSCGDCVCGDNDLKEVWREIQQIIARINAIENQIRDKGYFTDAVARDRVL